MNTIGSRINGQIMTTDGRNYIRTAPNDSSHAAVSAPLIMATGAEVAQSLAQTQAKIEQSAQELQKLSDNIKVNKLQFNVNEELGNVVIKIVDPSTNQVVREIPSEDMQRLHIRLKRTIGLLFDKNV